VTAGGALGVRGALTLRDSTLSTNTSKFGGGVAVLDGTAMLDAVDLMDNRATQNGGAVFLQNTTSTILDVTAVNNSASGSGGGISLIEGVSTIEDALLEDNFASSGGGGLAIGLTTTTVRRTRVESNDSIRFINTSPSLFSGFGAGIQIIDAKVRVEDSTLAENRGRWGWGMFVQRTSDPGSVDVDVVNTAFTGNANIVGDGGSAALEHWSVNGMTSTPVNGTTTFHCDNAGCAAVP
jgi:hypothetical protein